MSEVTRILDAIQAGEPKAASKLLPLVYNELRRLAAQKLAQEKPGQTLGATALVHEAYVRLVGAGDERQWDHSGHFFAAAAEAMRRILLDRARDKKRLKRGGDRLRCDLDLDELLADETPADDLIDFDEALGRLAAIDAQAAELVKLRLFAGMSLDDAAGALGLTRRTAKAVWAYNGARSRTSWNFRRAWAQQPTSIINPLDFKKIWS